MSARRSIWPAPPRAVLPASRPVIRRIRSRRAAPGWPGVRGAHIGHVRATNRAARRDAPPANAVANHRVDAGSGGRAARPYGRVPAHLRWSAVAAPGAGQARASAAGRRARTPASRGWSRRPGSALRGRDTADAGRGVTMMTESCRGYRRVARNSARMASRAPMISSRGTWLLLKRSCSLKVLLGGR